MSFNSIDSIIKSSDKVIVTMRHFHSKIQDFISNVYKNNTNSKGELILSEADINKLKKQFSKEIGHDFFSGLSSIGENFYKSKCHLYKTLLLQLLGKPLIIQVSPYQRCKETLALVLSDFNPLIAKSIINTRKEYFEFDINKVPITLKINDLLSERNMGNLIFLDLLNIDKEKEGIDQLTLPQKQMLRYYEKINGGESMIDVTMRCKMMLSECLSQNINQFRISHLLFLNQLVNTLKQGSFYGYADEDNKNLPNGSINILKIQNGKIIPEITGYVLE